RPASARFRNRLMDCCYGTNLRVLFGVRRARRRGREPLLDLLRGAIQPLSEIMPKLMTGPGREQQGERAADHRSERDGPHHGERRVVGGALLLQADPVKHVVRLRQPAPELLRKILEGHQCVLRWSIAPRTTAASRLPAIARPPVSTSSRTTFGVSPPPNT